MASNGYCYYCRRPVHAGCFCPRRSSHSPGIGSSNMALHPRSHFEEPSGFSHIPSATQHQLQFQPQRPPPPQVFNLPPPIRGTDVRPFVQRCFHGHSNGDALRSILRGCLESDWWFAQTAAPRAALDQFVSADRQGMRCRFCQRLYPVGRGGRSQAARQALACVYNHINYHPH